MESNSSNFIYTVTPQFWFGRLLSHSFHSRFEKSILLYQVPLVLHCCLMDSLWYFWLHPLINSTHIFYNWMEPLPIFSFFNYQNPWLSVPPFQKTRKSLININPTFISSSSGSAHKMIVSKNSTHYTSLISLVPLYEDSLPFTVLPICLHADDFICLHTWLMSYFSVENN